MSDSQKVLIGATNLVIKDTGTQISNNLTTLNFSGSGVTLTPNQDGSVISLSIPGQTPTNTVLTVGSVVTQNTTLTSQMNNMFLPCNSGIVITIPADTLPVSYSVILFQNQVGSISVSSPPNVVVYSPNGAMTQGMYTTLALIQISTNVWLVTAGNESSNSGGSGGGPLILGPDSGQKGTIVFGGASATYTQSNGTVTVTKTSHGFNSSFNGKNIFMMRGTGLFGFSNGAPQDYNIKYFEVCTNFHYIDANNFSCISNNTQTSSGNIGSPPDQFFNCPALSIIIPPSSIGANGYFLTKAMLSQNLSSNNKWLSMIWGPDNSYDTTGTGYQLWSGSVNGYSILNGDGFEIHNLNSESAQAVRPTNIGFGGTTYSQSGRPPILTNDTTQQMRFVFGVRLASSSDWALLEYGHLEFYKKS